jgi:RNA polymerase sigma-70 factor (ECF subfamily)
LLAELYRSIDNTKARHYLQKAHSLAKTQTEKQNIQQKIDNLL